MIFNAFQREDDDAVFTVSKNVAASAMAQGDAAYWDSSASADGVRVAQATTATLSLFRGIVSEAAGIAVDGYGRVQIHGYNASAKCEGTTDIAIGDALKGVNAQRYLIKGAAGDGMNGFVYAAEAYTDAAVALKKVFIRAL